jgi:autotransporter-associated beta strand protein
MGGSLTSASAQTWLVNLNDAAGYRGASQNGTDANGNLWNNINPWGWVGIQTTFGTSSGNFRGNLLGTSAGVDSFNGPLGSNVSNPLTQAQVDSVVIDSAALGLLGGSKAAAAGYASSNATNGWNFYLGNLNSNLTYDVSFYGANRWGGTSVYSAFSGSNFTTQIQSISLNVGGSGVYNSNQTATLTGLRTVATQDSSQGLHLRMTGSSNGTSGYVNAMLLYGYIGYLDGSSTTLNGAPAAGYIGNGNYTNGDSRSLDTVIGGGSSLTVNSSDGIFYNSTVIIRAGGATINVGGNFTAYALSGSGNLTVGGVNQWTISNSGNYSGNLTLSGAKLQLSANGSLGTGNLSLAGGELRIGSSNALGSGSISINSGVTTLVNYNGLTALTGNNPIFFNGGGTLLVNGSSQILSLGSGNVVVTGSNTLNASSGGMRFEGIISGVGSLNWQGNGTLALRGTNTFNGNITTNAGTLEIGGAGLLGSGNYSGAISNSGNFIYASTANQTLSGIISGTGVLTKNASSTLTLSGNNTYTGATTINAGTIEIGASGRLGAGTYAQNITNNGTIIYSGTNAQTFSGVISGTGNLIQNASSTLTLSAENTFSGGVTINSGTLEVSGGNALNNTTVVTVASGGTFLVTTKEQINGLAGAGNVSVGTAGLTISTGTPTTSTFSGVLSGSGTLDFFTVSGGEINLAGDNTATSFTNLNGGNLRLSHVDAAKNLTLNLYGTSGKQLLFAAGNSTYNIGAFAAAAFAIDLGGNTISIGSKNVASTISGNLTGTGGGITKVGTAALTLSGSNSYTGGTTLSAGTLNIGHASALSTGAFVIANGTTLDNTSGGALTLAGNNPVTIGGTMIFGGANDLNLGTGAVSRSGALVFNINTNKTLTIGGAIGGASNVNFYAGAGGTLELAGANTLTGYFNVDGGNLKLSNVNALQNANFNPYGASASVEFGVAGANNYQIGMLVSSKAINLGVNSISVGSNNESNTYSGILSGTGGVIKSGSGTWTLSGNNTYTGATTISTGTLTVSGGSAIANTSAVSVASGAVFNLAASEAVGSIAGAGSVMLNSNTLTAGADNTSKTFSGLMIGTGGFTKSGSGTLTLSGNNTYTGATTISMGTILISSTGLLGGGSYSGNITNSGTFIYSGTNNQTISGAITGTGALTHNASSTLSLSGNNSYSGGTTINTGTFVIGHANAAGTGTITQTDGNSLLKIDTTGTITNAMSVYNVLASQSATLSGAITVNNATWDIETGDTLIISGDISGTGGITKNGAGTMILSGSNSYNSTTTVNAGTLNAASEGALGANNTVQVNGGSLLVSANGSLDNKSVTLNSTSTTVAGLSFSGNYSGLVDNLTLSRNSIIDLGEGGVAIMFDTIVMNDFTLDIYNWTGTTLWNGGTGNDTDKVYFGPDLSDEALARIYFHSGAVGGGDSFLGSGFDLGLQQTSWDSSLDGYHIIPVPEPETWATGFLLLLGGAWFMWKRNRKSEGLILVAKALLCRAEAKGNKLK